MRAPGFKLSCEPTTSKLWSVLRRAKESEGIWVAVEGLREQRGLPERTISSLFDAATGLRIRNSSHRRGVELLDQVEITNQVATNDLRQMVQGGLLEQRGAKRGTFYVAAKPLVEVREKVRADRQPIDASSLFDV